MEIVIDKRGAPVEPAGEAEWQIRCDLAAAYRLVSHFGWDDLLGTHLSARIPGRNEFLMNPLGLMFDEITASSLVKVNFDGEIVQDTPFAINRAGFIIHSAIHQARADLECVIHLHSRDAVAVSATKEGLLPLNQSAMIIRSTVARHPYEGVATNEDERQRLVSDLGDRRIMILDNHGALYVGASIAEAFYHGYMFEWACSTQVRTLAMGLELQPANPAAIERTEATIADNLQFYETLSRTLVWPALLRKLDRVNPGYRE